MRNTLAILLLAASSARSQETLRFLKGLVPGGTPSVAAPASRPADLATVTPPANAGADLSAEYRNAWSAPDAAFTAANVERLKGCKVVFVPGFMANVYIVLGETRVAERYRQLGYFDDQMYWLKSRGIEAERLDVQSEETPEHNAEIVAAAIAASAKPVILVTHSKGSLDSIEALVRHPELRGKVRGWLSIQGALLGSPVADFIADSRILTYKFRLLLRALGGNFGSLECLTTRASRERYERNKDGIAAILREIPFVAFASWKDSDPKKTNTLMEFSRNRIEKLGLKNDGLMPAQNSLLPGADYILAAGIDHTDTYMPSYETFDRVRFMKSLLAVLAPRLR